MKAIWCMLLGHLFGPPLVGTPEGTHICERCGLEETLHSGKCPFSFLTEEQARQIANKWLNE